MSEPHYGRCCCGRVDDLGDEPRLILNDIRHEVLGIEGNFCGLEREHIIRDLFAERDALREEIKKLKSLRPADANH